MAIAGGACKAFKLTARDGEIVTCVCVSVQRSVTTAFISSALDKLLETGTVYLLAYGDNLAQLQQRWANYHAEVE